MERGRSRKARSGCLGRIFGFVLFLIVAAVGVIAAVKYMPSRERADLDALYAAGGSDRVALYLNYERQEESGVYVDGQTYLPAAWVDANLNERFYWDANENKLLYTLPTDIVTVEIGSKDYSVSKEKKSEDYVILKTEGNTTYVALDFIQQYTNIDYEVYDSPNRVMITCDWGKKQVATVKSDTQVRYRGGVKSPIVTDVKKKDEVIVLENEQNWKKILTKDGYIGYVKKNALKNEKTKNVTRDFT